METKIMRSSVYAWIFIIAFMAMMPIQRMTGAFDFDQITLVVGLVIGAYLGVDGFAGIIKTGKLPVGVKYEGNRAKLESIVIATLVIVVEGVLLQYLMVSDPVLEVVFYPLPLTNIITMAAGCTAIYISGEKGKIITEDNGPTEGV